MKQSSLGLGTSTKRTRRSEFLDEMDRVVLLSDLVAQIAPTVASFADTPT
jgi:IS5 family transposase